MVNIYRDDFLIRHRTTARNPQELISSRIFHKMLLSPVPGALSRLLPNVISAVFCASSLLVPPEEELSLLHKG